MNGRLLNPDFDFLVEHAVGRLIRTSIGELNSIYQVTQIKAAVIGEMQRAGDAVIVCTDWRRIHVFAPDIADALISMFTVTNRRVLRGAILLAAENATLTLQLERVLQTSHNIARRAFRDPEFMLRWLGAVLTPAELECAQEFIRGRR
jgi:hypothetical protein